MTKHISELLPDLKDDGNNFHREVTLIYDPAVVQKLLDEVEKKDDPRQLTLPLTD